MGKILKAVVPIALLFIPGIGTALSAIIGATLTSVVAVGVLGAAISGTANLLGLGPKAPKFEDPGQRLTLTTSPTQPRQMCYGKAATGGDLVFRDTVGTKNSDLWMVTVLAGHEIDSVTEVKLGGVTTTFTSNNAVGAKNSKWYQYKHLGTDAQTADTGLVSASTKWTTNHRLRGCANIVNKFIYDQVIFDKGLEAVLYTIKGKKVYDPRLDTTNGGTGSHRFTDKTTWAWSENPVLCLIDYLRGETQNGVLIWGMGQVETAFDWASVIAEANICEEAITLKAGGTEARYTCNGFLDSSAKHETNIRSILSSCAGGLVWQSGKWQIYVGAARTATYTRTESHFIGPVKYIPKKDYQARTNAIRGLYNDPEADYQAKDYPPVINSTFVAEDGGQELWGDLNLPMTKSKSTAQRLASIALKASRMEKVFSTTMNTIGFQDQAMDSVNLTYPRFNLSAQKMIISDWALRFQNDDDGNVGLVVEETLIETDDAIYSWTASTDEATIPAVTPLLNPAPELLQWEDVANTVGNKPANNATLGATWGIDLGSRPTELTDGRVSAGLDTSGYLDFSRAHLNKSLDNVPDTVTRFAAIEAGADATGGHTSADTTLVSGIAALTVKDGAAKADLGLDAVGTLISGVKDQKVLPPVLVTGAGRVFNAQPVTSSTDNGADASITIAPSTIYLGSGLTVSYPLGVVAGLLHSTAYHIYGDDPTYSGTLSGGYVATQTFTDVASSDGRFYFGSHTTVASGGGTGGTWDGFFYGFN